MTSGNCIYTSMAQQTAHLKSEIETDPDVYGPHSRMQQFQNNYRSQSMSGLCYPSMNDDVPYLGCNSFNFVEPKLPLYYNENRLIPMCYPDQGMIGAQGPPLDYCNPSMEVNQGPISPYDICELHVYSLHELQDGRESLRILGVAAGECLHNIYRIVMTSLAQREDRARLVFHAWILSDGRIYGYGPRYRHVIKDILSDREIYLNQLPIKIGYQLGFVFGKCIYLVVIHDIISNLTNENDLIWVPRICEGSYGEAIPFDLCYAPHLFAMEKELSAAELHYLYEHPDQPSPRKSEEKKTETTDSQNNSELESMRPKFYRNRYLDADELDEINLLLSKMRFIRQNSQIKPLLRRHRPEDILSENEDMRKYHRMTPRSFFCTLWFHQFLKTSPTSSEYLYRLMPNNNVDASLMFESKLNETYPMVWKNPTKGYDYCFPRCRVSIRHTVSTKSEENSEEFYQTDSSHPYIKSEPIS